VSDDIQRFHRGSGDGMRTEETERNTGNPDGEGA